MQIKADPGNDINAFIASFYRLMTDKKMMVIYFILVLLLGTMIGVSAGYVTSHERSPLIRDYLRFMMNLIPNDGLKSFINNLPQMTKIINSDNLDVPSHYVSGIESNPEQIYIDIKFKDFEKISEKRNEAIAKGMLLSSDDDFVPAMIRYNDRIINVKLRLKGNYGDHWTGNKWSYRIHVEDNQSLFGMKIFSIQDPATRGNINEWVALNALRQDGLIALRYQYIGVTINGKYMGIYALEEGFADECIEYNGYQDGPIVMFDDKPLISFLQQKQELINENLISSNGIYSDRADAYVLSQVTASQLKSQFNNTNSREQLLLAKDLLESYKEGTRDAHDVFNVDKLARFEAILALLGGVNGASWADIRFYYNPTTAKLEPIGYDTESGLYLDSEDSRISGIILDKDLYPYRDAVFFASYARELERVSQQSYIDEMIEDLGPGLEKNLSILYKDNPTYHYDSNYIQHNLDYIQKKLNPEIAFYTYYNNASDKFITLDMANAQEFPVEIISISCNGTVLSEPENCSCVLKTRLLTEPLSYEKVVFNMPDNMIWSEDLVDNLQVNYRILGTQLVRNTSISVRPQQCAEASCLYLLYNKPNIEKFDILTRNDTSRIIHIKNGMWTINESMIIPDGYTVICDRGTQLDFTNNSAIISYSPLEFFGTEEYPIVITSSDSTGQGIAVLNADAASTFAYVTISNLSVLPDNIPATVLVYQSDAGIDHCVFDNTKFGLCIYRSDFKVKNALFRNLSVTAIELDYSYGYIDDTVIVRCGANGINISGSIVDMSSCQIKGTVRSGISVDESSNVIIRNSIVDGCDIGLISESPSSISVINCRINDCMNGVITCSNRFANSTSSIVTSRVIMTGVKTPYLVKDSSVLIVDGKKTVVMSGNSVNSFDAAGGD